MVGRLGRTPPPAPTSFHTPSKCRLRFVEALREAEIGRWPYVHFRGYSEQVELDRAEAA
ncbi:MAG: hypothetical protein GY856_50145 [bacterium]|nr:hypothetical protein [bacterium]